MQETLFDKTWMFNESELSGIRFGYGPSLSTTLQHEHGIQGIRESFGVCPNAKIGIEARKITNLPAHFHCIENEKSFVIALCKFKPSIDGLVHDSEKRLNWSGRKVGFDDFVTYWDRNSFVLITSNKDLYIELKDAFCRMDVSIEMSKGLTFRIISNTPDGVKESMIASDLDAVALNEEALKTEIEKKLKAAGREFNLLVPRWKDETKSLIVFWLIPKDDVHYDKGTYTLEDLNEWVEDKGPVRKYWKKTDENTGETKVLPPLKFEKTYRL